MNILIVGSGAREHAITKALARSQKDKQLFCYASQHNPGIMALAQVHIGDLNDNLAIVNMAIKHQIDFAIIGPEAPLANGVVDALHQQNIAAIGPTQILAQIESSKGFTRQLMQDYQIPGQPQFQHFTQVDSTTEAFLAQLGENYVVKADGLMGGKGVKIAGEHLHSHQDALDFCQQINGPFVIEEKLQGPEFSLISFSDGQHLAHCPAIQDYKRAYEGNTGPNTGGMGSYSMPNHRLPFLSEADVNAAQAINQATVNALKDRYDQPYIGFLYGGFMKTANGVKLIEYNARLGDPEAINILALLETDFIDCCQAMLNQQLDQLPINFSAQASVCKYIVPNGYPDNPMKNQTIKISDNTNLDGLYFAAIDQVDNRYLMTGSRAVAILSQNTELENAIQAANQAAEHIQGPVFYRRDIPIVTPA